MEGIELEFIKIFFSCGEQFFVVLGAEKMEKEFNWTEALDVGRRKVSITKIHDYDISYWAKGGGYSRIIEEFYHFFSLGNHYTWFKWFDKLDEKKLKEFLDDVFNYFKWRGPITVCNAEIWEFRGLDSVTGEPKEVAEMYKVILDRYAGGPYSPTMPAYEFWLFQHDTKMEFTPRAVLGDKWFAVLSYFYPPPREGGLATNLCLFSPPSMLVPVEKICTGIMYCLITGKRYIYSNEWY